MTKAVYFSLGLAALLLTPATVPAQDDPAAIAAKEAVMRQANTIVLRQKLSDAKAVEQRGDIINAAKLYQESVTLAEHIGVASIPSETQQALAGLSTTRLALARDAQSHGDYIEAGTQVQQVLNAEPKNAAAIAFKQKNDQMLAATKGLYPDNETLAQVPQIRADKIAASTLVQDGKLLYEARKLDEAEAKFIEAFKLDKDNAAALYYENLIKQARYARDEEVHNIDTQERMEKVERQWILPRPTANLPPIANPYATNDLIYTGPGRQAIVAKLDHIRLEKFSTGDSGMPLSEVLKILSDQSRLRDPERKGINFLINNNPDLSGQAIAAPNALGVGGGAGFGAGGGGFVQPAPQPQQLDPNTGLPLAPAAGATGAGTTEPQDISSWMIKIPNLNDVRMADVLDAIQLVAEHPIKYSIQDFAIVFSMKGAETPQLFMRTFRVDPNTFYSGLENVSAQSFGAVNNSGGGGGSSGGGGGGGGGSSGQNNGAVVGVVNAFSGAGGFRSSGQGGGGGGGGGGSQGGSGSLLNNQQGGGGAGGTGGGGGNSQNAGGMAYITTQTSAATPSELARAFFGALGVNLLQPVGKAVFFNDRLGVLFVKATESDLDTIERAIQVLNQVPPQVHIKARFIEVRQNDLNEMGFQWWLGQFNIGNKTVGTAGTAPSSVVPVSPANPIGAFPGNTAASLVAPAASDQLLTGGLRSTAPTLATITGIMTDPNFRVAFKALSQRDGVENLGEPEATTTSGRQTQMRATIVQTIIIGTTFQQGTAATTTTGVGGAGQ